MADISRALILVGQMPTGDTPFEKFIAALLARHRVVSASLAENATWSELPVEQLLADGLWPVAIRIAEMLAKKIRTERDFLDLIAPRMNRLINVGLSLGYRTAEDAVHDFQIRILPEIESETMNLPENQTLSASRLWQLPVSRFFAEQIKRALEAGRDLAARYRLLQKLNRAGSDDVLYITESEIEIIKEQLPFLSVESDAGFFPLSISFAQTVADNTLDYLELLRRLPINFRELEELQTADAGYPGARLSIEAAWFHTQIAKGLLTSPDREYLTLAEYPQLIRKREKRSDEELIEKFWLRMEARGKRFTPDERAPYLPFLLRGIGWLRHLVPKLDLTTLAGAYFRFSESDLERIIQVEKTPGVRPISWQEISVEEVERICSVHEGEILQGLLADVAELLWRCPKEIRDPVAEIVLQNAPEPRIMVQTFLGSQTGKKYPELLRFCWMEIPHGDFADWLVKLLRRIEAGQVEPRLFGSHWLACAFLRLPKTELPVLLQSTGIRETVARMLFDPYQLNAEEVKHLKDRMGAPLWWKFVLGFIVLLREGDFLSPTQEQDEIHPPWDELERAPGILSDTPLENLKPHEVRRLTRQFPEDELFTWIHAGMKGAPTAFRTFQKKRAAYYKRFKQA